MKLTLSIAALVLVLGSPFAYAGSKELPGTLNVTVLDENGVPVQDAPIYIYGEHKTRFVGGKEIPGTVTLSMPAGDYRVSSALVKRTGDYFDRYVSHEAHVAVVSGDNTVVVLTLKPIEPTFESIGLAELHKIGVPTEVASNLN
jgi:hypothetical protein